MRISETMLGSVVRESWTPDTIASRWPLAKGYTVGFQMDPAPEVVAFDIYGNVADRQSLSAMSARLLLGESNASAFVGELDDAIDGLMCRLANPMARYPLTEANDQMGYCA